MSANNGGRARRRSWRDASGAVAAEFGFVIGIVLVLVLGAIDLGQAFWQWSQATKALQLGVRLAAVSDPVSSDLKTMTGLSDVVKDGDPMPFYTRTCSGASQSCSGGVYDPVAMRTILYGRGNVSCPSTRQGFPPMCQIFPRLKPENIIIEYTHTGLGYAGRPGGPVPHITMRLTGLTYQFVILNSLLGLKPIQMAGLSAAATAEDMSGK